MKDYKQVWNNLSESFASAAYYVCCIDDEDEIRRNGKFTADFLKQVLEITPHDSVLEIGCGVARIGKELAPFCGEWHGADISGNMIAYAAERTAGMPNVYLHELPDSSLRIFPDNYFDCVYSSIVFMHLDKLDMFRYIKEACRVLTPGGRAYFDTFNLLGSGAWEQFLILYDTYPPDVRPGHMSQFSSPQELEKFMLEAGFDSVHVDGNNSQLVVGLGVKPAQPGFERPQLPPDMDPTKNAYSPPSVEGEGTSGQPEGTYYVAVSRRNVIAEDRAEPGALEREEHLQYIRKLEQTLDEKFLYIEELEDRLREYHEGMIKQQRLRNIGLIIGALVLARRGLGKARRRR